MYRFALHYYCCTGAQTITFVNIILTWLIYTHRFSGKLIKPISAYLGRGTFFKDFYLFKRTVFSSSRFSYQQRPLTPRSFCDWKDVCFWKIVPPTTAVLVSWCPGSCFFQIVVPQSHSVPFLSMKYCEKQKRCMYLGTWEKKRKTNVLEAFVAWERTCFFKSSSHGLTEALPCRKQTMSSLLTAVMTEARHKSWVSWIHSCYFDTYCYGHIEMCRQLYRSINM